MSPKCPSCDSLQSRLDKAEAACAEMREAILRLEEVEHARGTAPYADAWSRLAGSLSSTAGNDWVRREELNKREILLCLWSGTFQKYQSWKANDAPPDQWPKAVVDDYERLNALAKEEMAFDQWIQRKDVLPIVEALKVAESLSRALSVDGRCQSQIEDALHLAQTLGLHSK